MPMLIDSMDMGEQLFDMLAAPTTVQERAVDFSRCDRSCTLYSTPKTTTNQLKCVVTSAFGAVSAALLSEIHLPVIYSKRVPWRMGWS